MHKVASLAVEKSLFEANKRIAKENHDHLKDHGVCSFDFMGSIGSGKTLIIEKLIDMLKAEGKRVGAIAGDVSGNDDYLRFLKHTDIVANVNTGKDCHLDAHRIEHALDDLALEGIDYLFIENVGNLVCPSDFPLGTDKRIVVISTTEGDDMIRKHPVIFGLADLIVINKVDLAPMVDVDVKVLLADAKRIAPGKPVQLTDAKHGKGLGELLSALRDEK